MDNIKKLKVGVKKSPDELKLEARRLRAENLRNQGNKPDDLITEARRLRAKNLRVQNLKAEARALRAGNLRSKNEASIVERMMKKAPKK